MTAALYAAITIALFAVAYLVLLCVLDWFAFDLDGAIDGYTPEDLPEPEGVRFIVGQDGKLWFLIDGGGGIVHQTSDYAVALHLNRIRKGARNA